MSVATVCDFSALAICYAELNGPVRPTAESLSLKKRTLQLGIAKKCGFKEESSSGTMNVDLVS